MNVKYKMVLAMFFSQLSICANYEICYYNDEILLQYKHNNLGRPDDCPSFIFINQKSLLLLHDSVNFILNNSQKYLLNVYKLQIENVYKFLTLNLHCDNYTLDFYLLNILCAKYQEYKSESIYILKYIKSFCCQMNNTLNKGKAPMTPRKDSFIQLIEDLEKIDTAYEEGFENERIDSLYKNLEEDLKNARNFMNNSLC